MVLFCLQNGGCCFVHKCEGTAFPVQAYSGKEVFKEFGTPTVSRQMAQEGGKVVSPTHWPP